MSIDFPRAWAIAASIKHEYHHNECSFNVSRGGALCDCDVIHKHPEYTDKINFKEVSDGICNEEGCIELGKDAPDANQVRKFL